MRPNQVFIVGMNGSGTTMLLDCLAGHSLLYGFRGETKVLPYFIERQAQYGDLADDRNFAKLWRDLQGSIGGRDWPKDGGDLAIEHWGNRPRSAAAIFDWIMSALAAAEGKSIWCEKTPMYVHHLGLLAEAFPTAKFIHVIRDGRNCAASFHRRWQFNPVRTAYRWKQAVEVGRMHGARIGSRYCEIQYEKFTAVPEESFRNLCAFLSVPFEASILRPARLRPQMTGSSEDSVAPNERRAEQYFSPAVLKSIEAVAGGCLAECGYVTHYLAGDQVPSKWKLRWWEVMDDRRRMKQAVRTAAGIGRSGGASYLTRRLRGALKQKVSLKP